MSTWIIPARSILALSRPTSTVRHAFAALLLAACTFTAQAQTLTSTTEPQPEILPLPSLPIGITAGGDVAVADIAGLAQLTLSFDDASGLNANTLGLSAQLVDLLDPNLLLRLPTQANLLSALPLLITVEPPGPGGLKFDRTVNVEIHTHLLPYTNGSRLRVFKAPLGGQFRDITHEIAPGSVRARGTTGGFSQFLILLDTRSTWNVIAEKFSYLRTQTAMLPAAERAPLDAQLDAIAAALNSADYATAISGIDGFRSSVADRAAAGAIPQTWRASRDLNNTAGELLAGAATLRFSVAYLRDFGQ